MIEHPAFKKSGYQLDKVLYLDIKFHKLNLTRGNSYIPLPSWIAKKKAIINPKNENDEECFKWAVTAALNYEKIKNHPERISKLEKYSEKYNWNGLEFPMEINKIYKFEKGNPDIAVNVLSINGNEQMFTLRKTKFLQKIKNC